MCCTFVFAPLCVFLCHCSFHTRVHSLLWRKTIAAPDEDDLASVTVRLTRLQLPALALDSTNAGMTTEQMVLTEPLVKFEQTETLMLTEQMEKMRLVALMELTENIITTETMSTTSQMPTTAVMVMTIVTTKQMVLTEPPVKMVWMETLMMTELMGKMAKPR